MPEPLRIWLKGTIAGKGEWRVGPCQSPGKTASRQANLIRLSEQGPVLSKGEFQLARPHKARPSAARTKAARTPSTPLRRASIAVGPMEHLHSESRIKQWVVRLVAPVVQGRPQWFQCRSVFRIVGEIPSPSRAFIQIAQLKPHAWTASPLVALLSSGQLARMPASYINSPLLRCGENLAAQSARKPIGGLLAARPFTCP